MKILYFLFAVMVLFFLEGLTDAVKADPSPETKKGAITNPRDSLPIYDTLVEESRINDIRMSIFYAKRALKIAQQSGKPEDLVLAYIINGISFNTSDKDSSYYYFVKALKLAEAEGLLRQKIRVIYNLAMFYNQADDYNHAIVLLDSTIHMAETIKDWASMAEAYNSRGTIKFTLHMNADAKKIFEIALKIAMDHSLYRETGNALGNLAEYQDNNAKANSMRKEAISYLKKAKGTEEQVANLMINIANRSEKADTALIYFMAALKLAKNKNLPKCEIGAYNGMVYSYMDLGNISAAETYIIHAIELALQVRDDDWLSTLYDSYSDILVKEGRL